ncbi:helix-turn-helix domain-containing protein [Breznakiellaceae bacterium SP9]
MKIEKVAGFNRIYQAECFPDEFSALVGKNRMNIKGKIADKLAASKKNTWMLDSLSPDEQIAAEFIAKIAVSIQTARRERGYTQKELAERIGVSQVMISRWENGDENFTVATLAKISSVLGIGLVNPLYQHTAQAV